MDSENTNHADYAHDLDMCLKLTEALLRLQEIMEANPVRSPSAIVAFNTVLFGTVVQFNISNCDHDSECSVTAPQPCGGFLDALEMLDEAIEVLRLEVNYNGDTQA